MKRRTVAGIFGLITAVTAVPVCTLYAQSHPSGLSSRVMVAVQEPTAFSGQQYSDEFLYPAYGIGCRPS